MKITKKIAGLVVCFVLMSSQVLAMEIEPRAMVCPNCNAGKVIEELVGDEVISRKKVDCIHGSIWGYDVIETHRLTYTQHCSENCGFRDYREGTISERLCSPF